ncbi:MAG: response regulator [Nanoarchaeota archaeon]|nr:response regulator [Nanoarchaeota archaeon]
MKKILIADNDKNILNLYLSYLEDLKGYDIRTAKNGLETIEKIVEDKPDILVIDINIPCANGQGLCKRIRNNPETKDIYIIVSSGFNLPEETREYIDTLFLKPYPVEDLIEKLEDIGGKDEKNIDG